MIANFLASTTSRIIVALALMIAVMGFIVWAQWDDAEQPKQEARSAKAAAATAKETAQTVIDRAGSDASVDALVAETARQIDTLPAPEAASVARRAICSFPEYKDDPSCVN